MFRFMDLQDHLMALKDAAQAKGLTLASESIIHDMKSVYVRAIFS